MGGLKINTNDRIPLHFRYSEGRIYQKSTPPTPRLEFSFKNLSDLCDVTIETEDGDELMAHKSVLVAR